MKIINYLFYIIFIILLIIIIRDLCSKHSKKCYYEFYTDSVPSNPSICNAKYTCTSDKKCVPDLTGLLTPLYDSSADCIAQCTPPVKPPDSLPNKLNAKQDNVVSDTPIQPLHQVPYNNTICADPSSLSEKEKKRASGPRAGIFIIKNGDNPVKPVKYYNISKYNDLYKLVEENPQALHEYMKTVNSITELNKKRKNRIEPISQYIYLPKK